MRISRSRLATQEFVSLLTDAGLVCFFKPAYRKHSIDGPVLGFYMPGRAIVVTTQLFTNSRDPELCRAAVAITFRHDFQDHQGHYDFAPLIQQIHAQTTLRVGRCGTDRLPMNRPPQQWPVISQTLYLTGPPQVLEEWALAIQVACGIVARLPGLGSHFRAFNASSLYNRHPSGISWFFDQPHAKAAVIELSSMVSDVIFVSTPDGAYRKHILWISP